MTQPPPSESVFALVDAVAGEAMRMGVTSPDGALRAQAALVRSLVDEVQRCHPSEHWIAPLHEQLGEELARLEQIVRTRSSHDGLRGGALEDDAPNPVDVLVVDDHAAALRALGIAVRAWGYPCRVADKAEEAIRAYREQPAAIVLSDWSMPGMSGLELCAALKSEEPAPYVILVTAFHDDDQLLERARGNADDFLGKPVDLDELSSRLLAASRLLRAVRSVAALTEWLRSTPPAGSS